MVNTSPLTLPILWLTFIPLYDGNATLKRYEPLRCANKRRHGMTALDRLAHEFQPNPPGRTQYKYFHKCRLDST